MDTVVNHNAPVAPDMLGPKIDANPFVLYLNSLQSIRGNNISALAESQSVNRNFSLIEEKHPLSEIICKDLLSGKNVILTGHAGDGKSTIAIEVYKMLLDLDLDKPLDTALATEEHISSKNITIIKDLSECTDSKALLDRIFKEDSSFLVITNTGALLSMFNNYQSDTSDNESKSTESEILEQLNHTSGELKSGPKPFSVYNLARRDNLRLARKVLIRMLDERNWVHCSACLYKDSCPILANRELLASKDYRAVDRIFLIYRRLLAYGTRLTMRQLLEHLAWSITGGKSIYDAKEFSATNMYASDELFHHLFFGNDGLRHYPLARHMRAVATLNAQAFGNTLAPERERTFWSEAVSIPHLDLPEFLDQNMPRLRHTCLHPNTQNAASIREAAAARTAVRRIVYFYGKGDAIDDDIDDFLSSPFTRKWQNWSNENGPDTMTSDNLHKEIMFVLRNHFSGHKSSADDDFLEIALHRDTPGLRQSVQLLTAQIHIRSAFRRLEWKRDDSSSDVPSFELLLRHADHEDIFLRLDVAFLDYVHRRFCGEISGSLSRAYKQRLENFRNRLTAVSQTSDTITLLRFLTDMKKDTFQCCVSDTGKIRIV